MTREEAIKVLNYFIIPSWEGTKLYNACQMAVKAIADRPHGEWEHWGSPFTDDTIANSIVCSLCKARYVEIDGEVFNFCPNCGADMREGEAE